MTRRRMIVTVATSAAMAVAGVGAWVLADRIDGRPGARILHGGGIIYGPYRVRPVPQQPFATFPPLPVAPPPAN